MSLQIRRGTEAQRTGVVFDSGEIIFTTDTQKLYVGDGITAGGKNVLASSAGAGVSFNNTTQAFDFTRTGLGLTTSDITEGVNLYHTRQRAQDDAAALFTATGAPTSAGNITATSAPNTVTISGNTTGMTVGERFVVAGTAGNGLTATTYYIAQVLSIHSVTLSSTRLNALANPQVLVTVTTNASYTGTTYASGGEDSNIVFTYDSVNHTMIANVTLDGVGISSVQSDPAPNLGGDLVLNGKNITGTGNINITGSGTFTSGTITSGTITTLTAPTTTIATKLNVDAISSISSLGTKLSADGTTPLTVTGIGTLGPTSGQVYFNINAAKGTIASPTTTAAGDGLGGIAIQGYTGATYKAAGLMIASWDSGAVLTDTYPKSTLTFATYGGGSTIRLTTINNLGVLESPVQRTTVYSVAGTALPSATAVGNGARAFVSDATATTFASAYTGGGSNKVPVYSDGSVWRIG
jgi:hypothetical protein